MATLQGEDPFARTDGSSIDVPRGVFTARDEHLDRTGSTNARLLLGGPFARFRAAPSAARTGWIAVGAALLAVVIVIPAAIGSFASVRKESLAASTAEAALPTVLVLSPETLAVDASIGSVDPAYLMSKGIADEEARTTMGNLLAAADAAIEADDATLARTEADSAIAYFISDYSQRVAANAETILEEYPYSEEETDERFDELLEVIRANAQGQDLGALVAAVIELPQVVGDAQAEHLGNRRTYTPPEPKATTAPSQPPATQAPQVTSAPAPSQQAPEPEPKPTTEPKPKPEPKPSQPAEPDEPGFTGQPRP